MHQDSRYKT